jgi:thymidylate synthase
LTDAGDRGLLSLMEDFKPPCVLKARDLDDAWFTALWACLEKNEDGTFRFSQRYKIDRGSYAGQERLEIDTFLIDIAYPGSGPLVPQMPSGKENLAPTTEEQAQNYLLYLMTGEKQPNEEYTYGERLVGPRAVISVDGVKKKGDQVDPAGLELVVSGEAVALDGLPKKVEVPLDLYNGFPVNLAGLQQLKKYMADEIGVGDGAIRAVSKGLHLYDDMWELASLRTGKDV